MLLHTKWPTFTLNLNKKWTVNETRLWIYGVMYDLNQFEARSLLTENKISINIFRFKKDVSKVFFQ
jgi:hypothetical protein